ncbi:hypothetical protein CERSUDRAFT_109283 [Gelatoporia subvermispora B]|uniref:Uncharacterized protein n=1 Tax=Ceriporiopsis subvermispora (strain B) TaxID=914234 RepID=M2QYW9_CERS8|nr:hypothetical protein CERSUDRAFT_109283 [Gelatoporia subvermispora B]
MLVQTLLFPTRRGAGGDSRERSRVNRRIVSLPIPPNVLLSRRLVDREGVPTRLRPDGADMARVDLIFVQMQPSEHGSATTAEPGGCAPHASSGIEMSPPVKSRVRNRTRQCPRARKSGLASYSKPGGPEDSASQTRPAEYGTGSVVLCAYREGCGGREVMKNILERYAEVGVAGLC